MHFIARYQPTITMTQKPVPQTYAIKDDAVIGRSSTGERTNEKQIKVHKYKSIHHRQYQTNG